MVMEEYIKRIMKIFSESFINSENEIILVPRTNLYFGLNDVKSEFDVKCKLIEWCSRDACKSMPYASEKINNKYHKMVRDCINRYLGTNFSFKDMNLIYCELGNGVNHDLTIKFVKSGYDLKLLGGLADEQNVRNHKRKYDCTDL